MPWARDDADASTSRRRTAGDSRRASSCARTSSARCSCATPTAAKASSSAAPACIASTGRCAGSRSATGVRPACEQGAGFVTEAVRALARLAFDALDARRVEIRMRRQQRAQLARRRARRLHARGAAATAIPLTPAGEPRGTRGLRARARRRGADRRRPADARAGALVGDAGAGREAVDRVGDDAVDAERDQPRRLGRVVDRVDERAQAGAVDAARAAPASISA